jgi:hypothetical protein
MTVILASANPCTTDCTNDCCHDANTVVGAWLPSSSSQAADFPPGDWELMLHAVNARLVDLVAAAQAAREPTAPAHSTVNILAAVQDCIAALDQLHLSLRHERARFDAQLAHAAYAAHAAAIAASRPAST